MASTHIIEYDKAISVRRAGEAASSWQAVEIKLGCNAIYLSREEAAQLAADLLNAVDAQPMEGNA